MIGPWRRTHGKGNQVIIGASCRLWRLVIDIRGRNNRIEIGENCRLAGLIVVHGNDQTVRIGAGTTFADAYLLCRDGCDLTLGAHCMLSRKVEIRTSDAHALVDRASGERLNTPGSVAIGRHVWIGVGALVSKGVNVADDVTIAAGAFVNRSIEESHVAVAGAPARIIRRGVSWRRSNEARYAPETLDDWR